MLSLLDFEMVFMFAQTLHLDVFNINLPLFHEHKRKKINWEGWCQCSVWVLKYTFKKWMFSMAHSVLPGRVFVASSIHFVLCNVCFHKSTRNISLIFGDAFYACSVASRICMGCRAESDCWITLEHILAVRTFVFLF